MKNKVHVRLKNNVLLAGNPNYQLMIKLKDRINPLRLTNIISGQIYADADYIYYLKIKHGRKILQTTHSFYQRHSIQKVDDGGVKIILQGTPGADNLYVPDIVIEHFFFLYPNDPYLEERVNIINMGSNNYYIMDLRFGFQKRISSHYSLRSGKFLPVVKDFQFIAVPFGHPDDPTNRNRVLNPSEPWVSNPQERYSLKELVLRKVKAGAEGWILTDGKYGFLIIKHSPNMIEYSLLDINNCHNTLGVRFGGVGIFRGDPEEFRKLNSKSRINFGSTRYIFYKGGWKEGFYEFRKYMSSLGHGIPPGYNPPAHWNVIYNLGWKKYSLNEVEKEARLARDMGCEAIYLDPCWNTIEGGEIWDEGRLGSLKTFVRRMESKYNLKVALHTMSNVGPDWFPDNSFNRVNKEYPGCLRKDSKGRHYKIDSCWAICQGAKKWQKEKTKRLIKLVEQGIKFILFDYCILDLDLEQYRSCYDETHGHHVPLTKDAHIKGMMEVLQNVKKHYPYILIESHDGLVGGRYSFYHPCYFRHDWTNSFDEIWGFENMWDPLTDILTGRALTFYYYNLAHELPLYLHINMSKDNLKMLQFWWYASTVKHLGVGGVKDISSPLYKALRNAMRIYKRLREFYINGHFFGINEWFHIHSLPSRNEAVINAFNLSPKEIIRKETIDLKEIGLDPKKITSVEGIPFEKRGSKMTVILRIPALSPLLTKIK